MEFLHSVGVFGEQRSESFVLLPQVFYRYLVKIIPGIDYSYFPTIFATWLELITAVLFGFLGILGILTGLASGSESLKARRGVWGVLAKINFRLSYAIYLIFGYIIPTLSGSFSSLPRYVVVLFPAFILSSIYLSKLKKAVQYVVYLLLMLSLVVATTLFVRGHWVA